jgi:hypothetical protein
MPSGDAILVSYSDQDLFRRKKEVIDQSRKSARMRRRHALIDQHVGIDLVRRGCAP